MGNLVDASGRINRELVGTAVTMGDHLVQPVARMVGRAQGTGVGVQITPVRMAAVDAQGRESMVSVFDLTRQSLCAVAGAALAVAAVCSLIMVLRKLAGCSR